MIDMDCDRLTSDILQLGDAMDEIMLRRWYEAVGVRISRRQYTGEPVELEVMRHLVDVCKYLNSQSSGTRVEMVPGDPDKIFRGIVGSYGKVQGAPACAAFIGDRHTAHYQEKTGYIGECFVLEATAAGLNTCWVAGCFRPEIVNTSITMLSSEQVLAMTAVGCGQQEYTWEEKIMTGVTSGRNRRKLSSLCSGLPEQMWPQWVRSALAAARLAPSAVNRQPWRFTVGSNSVTVSANSSTNTSGISKRLDCGIAMAHIEVGAFHAGKRGMWEYLSSPRVARFTVTGE